MMLKLIKKLKEAVDAQASLTLPLASRVKSRLRSTLDDGREVGLFLERGQTLYHGDLLVSTDGLVVKVIAADETVSTVDCDDYLLQARASYHLGNRHVALQIKPGQLRYLHDHVLDDMLKGFGLTVKVEKAPFEPEPGAYQSTGLHHHEH
jgi:urease accessory protein